MLATRTRRNALFFFFGCSLSAHPHYAQWMDAKAMVHDGVAFATSREADLPTLRGAELHPIIKEQVCDINQMCFQAGTRAPATIDIATHIAEAGW